MPFALQELASDVRELMVAEIKAAQAAGTVYFSKRFNDAG